MSAYKFNSSDFSKEYIDARNAIVNHIDSKHGKRFSNNGLLYGRYRVGIGHNAGENDFVITISDSNLKSFYSVIWSNSKRVIQVIDLTIYSMRFYNSFKSLLKLLPAKKIKLYA